MKIRLQKVLSAAGVASRRAAETLISDGRVSVNGTLVRELGTRADPERDDIRVDGRRIKLEQRRRYVLLNKPRGYVTTRRDPEGRPTVLDLLKDVGEYVYPVGRLDFDSEGLLLLTNDGDLAASLTHPRHDVEREYEVIVEGVPSADVLRYLREGIVLDGRRTRPATVRALRRTRTRSGERTLLQMTIREGRNRQIRRMCEAVGHRVLGLRRVRIGPIHDASLKPGEFRELTAREILKLKATDPARPPKS
jgi:pseudouridine synthase